MLDDCQARLLITNQRNMELSQNLFSDGRRLLNIDELDGSCVCDDLNCRFHGMFYRRSSIPLVLRDPKGVAHSHRSQLHTVMINTNAARISCHDRLTLLHTVDSDSAQAHLFQALLNGGTLCSFDLKSEGNPSVAPMLNEESVTCFTRRRTFSASSQKQCWKARNIPTCA
jgi:hypothetical protein